MIELYYEAQRDCPETGDKGVELPLSKSVALRVLTLNAVSESVSGRAAHIPVDADSEDVKGLERAISLYRSQIGAGTRESSNTVNIGEGGAPFRFFTALAASTPGIDLTLATRRPLLRRPHRILLDALREAGADIRCLRGNERPPLRIIGKKLDPSELTLNAGVSSQYVSALMMAAPLWENGLHLTFGTGRVVSLPYLEMTASIMRQFGCEVTLSEREVRVAPRRCVAPESYDIPTDWSAVSYFYELALLLQGEQVKIARLTTPELSLQGDSACRDIFAALGVRTKIFTDGSACLVASSETLDRWRSGNEIYVIDLSGTPDLAPALAVGLCLAGVRFRFDNAGHLKHKETDRMAALASELHKLGYVVWTADESMGWNGEKCPVAAEQPEISTYSDHRMAMAFAPAAAAFPGLRIKDPEVVGKSYPRFWENLAAIGFRIKEIQVS